MLLSFLLASSWHFSTHHHQFLHHQNIHYQDHIRIVITIPSSNFPPSTSQPCHLFIELSLKHIPTFPQLIELSYFLILNFLSNKYIPTFPFIPSFELPLKCIPIFTYSTFPLSTYQHFHLVHIQHSTFNPLLLNFLQVHPNLPIFSLKFPSSTS